MSTENINLARPSEFHHYHTLSINLNFIKKIAPPILFSLTLFAIIKTEGDMKELLYPLGAFTGLCVLNNFRD
ncbi:MAG TPA: hypothetical protein PKD85_15495 [Saprospiraceae bacterium]|nr:hypothetical protein [Saprospiraceae bacterium]